MASRPPRLHRVIIPVSNIDHAARFYTELLGIHGEREVWDINVRRTGCRHRRIQIYHDKRGTELGSAKERTRCIDKPSIIQNRFSALHERLTPHRPVASEIRVTRMSF